MHGLARALIVVFVIWNMGILSGCREANKEAVRLPPVTVTSPVEREVTRYLEYTGTDDHPQGERG